MNLTDIYHKLAPMEIELILEALENFRRINEQRFTKAVLPFVDIDRVLIDLEDYIEEIIIFHDVINSDKQVRIGALLKKLGSHKKGKGK